MARLNRASVVVDKLQKFGLHHLARWEVFDAQMFAYEWQVRNEEAQIPVNALELDMRRARLSALYKKVDDYKRDHGGECRGAWATIPCHLHGSWLTRPIPRNQQILADLRADLIFLSEPDLIDLMYAPPDMPTEHKPGDKGDIVLTLPQPKPEPLRGSQSQELEPRTHSGCTSLFRKWFRRNPLTEPLIS